MKKEVIKEISVCDICGEEVLCSFECFHCGKEICSDCVDKHGISYKHNINAIDDVDGFYCKSCDKALSETEADELHNTYVAIKNLSDEYSSLINDVWKRNEKLEKQLEKLLKKVKRS